MHSVKPLPKARVPVVKFTDPTRYGGLLRVPSHCEVGELMSGRIVCVCVAQQVCV